MKKFILLYNGPATDMADMSEEQSNEVMNKWQEWMEKTGEALVDIGAPLINGTAVLDDGSDGNASPLSGYTIVQAEDVAGAREIVNGHPFLSDNDGKFCIEIHELAPAPM